MADNNNAYMMDLPQEPNAKLKELSKRLVGKWKTSGPDIDGYVTFEEMTGGFFLIQHVDFTQHGQKIEGIEYISHDRETDTLRSHYMDNGGSNFAYTWQLDGETLKIYFGDQDSPAYYEGTFNKDGTENAGRWTYPGGGGYESTMTRV